MNGYICFYKGRKMEVRAETTLAAQREAAMRFNARRTYDVTAVLAETDAGAVTHKPQDVTP